MEKNLVAYLKKDARNGFKNYTKEGLNFILSYQNLPREIFVTAQKALQNLR